MRELKLSNLVLMDVSMKSYGGESYPNSGVMIEFGLLMNDRTKSLEYVYFFCDERTERNNLPFMIPRVDLQPHRDNANTMRVFQKASFSTSRRSLVCNLRGFEVISMASTAWSAISCKLSSLMFRFLRFWGK